MFVHEVLAGVIAYRISKLQRITFSISMNDYGFELLSDQEIHITEALELDLFSDRRRPGLPSYRGALRWVRPSPMLTDKLQSIGAGESAAFFSGVRGI